MGERCAARPITALTLISPLALAAEGERVLAGANFFVRASNRTLEFFEAVSAKLAHWYTPDMGIMIHQCHTWPSIKCSYMPHKSFFLLEAEQRGGCRLAHSWEWMYTTQKDPPYIIQLDCETDGRSKLAQLAKYGFHFIREDGSCDAEAVKRTRDRMEAGKIEVRSPREEKEESRCARASRHGGSCSSASIGGWSTIFCGRRSSDLSSSRISL